MLYLASQFAWFLFAAFGLGLAMGWVSHGGGKARLWNGAWTIIALLWAGGAALTWFQWLNGTVAIWVESALLFVGAYWVGCVCASVLPRSRVANSGRPAQALQLSMPGSNAERPLKPALEAAATGLPLVENEANLPGRRPSGRAAACGDKADDLELIKGIGPQNAGRLHGLGIWHFEQIAAWTPENVEWVGGYLAFPGRIEREDWVGQARVLVTDAQSLGGTGACRARAESPKH